MGDPGRDPGWVGHWALGPRASVGDTDAMSPRVLLASLVGAAVVGVGVAAGRYRRDLHDAYAHLAAVDRRVVSTAFGAVEYAERGTGQPLLISHGIFHGCDGGLVTARDLAGDRRVIAPSRFGYLGSDLPVNASGAAQAAAFVALLDHLDHDAVDVMAVSAGTSAAVQLALRHPDRVTHLVISSGNLPGSPAAIAPPGWAKAFYSDPAMWTLKVAAPAMLERLVGVPKGFPRTQTTRGSSPNSSTASSRSVHARKAPSSTHSPPTPK